MPREIYGSCLKQIGGNTVATCDLGCIVVVVCYYCVTEAHTLGDLQSSTSSPTARSGRGIFFFSIPKMPGERHAAITLHDCVAFEL